MARERGLRVGGAPDTFLGGGLQTCRKLLDDGVIGEPVAATAFMMGHGHESWHPDPEFYYQVGGGPMFDMGPYYLTALINLLGPVQREIGFVLTALRVAFWAALRAETFEQAVVDAANLGGDADTNAAVTGALAGARFGASAIPQRWIEPLHAKEHISGLGTRLIRPVD